MRFPYAIGGVLVAAALCVAAGMSEPETSGTTLLGETAPALSAVAEDGSRWDLVDERGKRLILVVTGQAMHGTAAAAERLRDHNTGLVVLRTDAGAHPDSGENWRMVTRPDAAQLRSYIAASVPGDSAIFFVDEGGVLRARMRGAKVDAIAVAALPARWETGKRQYEISCSRCHGDTGNDDSYPNAGKLGGIGNRHSLEEVLQLTLATGVVDLSRVSNKDKLDLALYVAGLSAEKSDK
jgi:mono/diheme cytochrome c family protein